MNFKNCDGALARILETLAIYDFDVQFRQGSRHTNANSIFRRPCLDQECAHIVRGLKRDIQVVKLYLGWPPGIPG